MTTELERPPYEAYAGIVGAYAAGIATVAALARLLGREPQKHTTLDLVTLAGATFKVSRTVARDQVASFIREPFVDEGEQPAGEGLQRALGELVTCSRCVGTWVAAGLMSAQMLAPRFGRILTWSLAAAAANDFLQAGFTALTKRA